MVEKKFLKLGDIEAYRISFALANYVWAVVVKWNHFEKETLGKQFVRAIDSISANIAEGFGRYSKKDKIKFYRYAQGSFYESLDWNEKAKVRELLTKEQHNYVFTELQKLPLSLNSLIKFTNNNLSI